MGQAHGCRSPIRRRQAGRTGWPDSEAHGRNPRSSRKGGQGILLHLRLQIGCPSRGPAGEVSQSPAPAQQTTPVKSSRSLTPSGWCSFRGKLPITHGRVLPHSEGPPDGVVLLDRQTQHQTEHMTEDTIMKHKTLLLIFLSVAAFAVGCSKEGTTSEQIDKLKTETKEAAQDMKDYTFAQKAEFVKQMQIQLDALNKDLDQLAAKIEKSSDAVKAEAKPKLQALDRKSVV